MISMITKIRPSTSATTHVGKEEEEEEGVLSINMLCLHCMHEDSRIHKVPTRVVVGRMLTGSATDHIRAVQ